MLLSTTAISLARKLDYKNEDNWNGYGSEYTEMGDNQPLWVHESVCVSESACVSIRMSAHASTHAAAGHMLHMPRPGSACLQSLPGITEKSPESLGIASFVYVHMRECMGCAVRVMC